MALRCLHCAIWLGRGINSRLVIPRGLFGKFREKSNRKLCLSRLQRLSKRGSFVLFFRIEIQKTPIILLGFVQLKERPVERLRILLEEHCSCLCLEVHKDRLRSAQENKFSILRKELGLLNNRVDFRISEWKSISWVNLETIGLLADSTAKTHKGKG